MKKDFDFQKFQVDRDGRVVFDDGELRALEESFVPMAGAGTPANSSCPETYNSSACTNGTCNGSINGSGCNNSVSCGGSSNGAGCVGPIHHTF